MDSWYVLEVFAKLIGVLLLFLGAALIARRWLGITTPGILIPLSSYRHHRRRLAVLESVRLSPRQALHLVRAGDHYFLIGATDSSVALVSAVGTAIDLDETHEAVASNEAAASSPADSDPRAAGQPTVTVGTDRNPREFALTLAGAFRAISHAVGTDFKPGGKS